MFLPSTTCRQAKGERDREQQAELPALTKRATLDLMLAMSRSTSETQDLLPFGVVLPSLGYAVKEYGLTTVKFDPVPITQG